MVEAGFGLKRLIIGGILCGALILGVQGRASAQLSASEDQKVYEENCAPCHGKDGRGDGQMAHLLKVQPADLTQLMKKTGKLPPADVHRMMPIRWFKREALSRKALGEENMKAIEAYLESMQQK